MKSRRKKESKKGNERRKGYGKNRLGGWPVRVLELQPTKKDKEGSKKKEILEGGREKTSKKTSSKSSGNDLLKHEDL